jgi:hypothetical protein
VTVPFDLAGLTGETVAVNVTSCPTSEGFIEDVSVVVVAVVGATTFCVTDGDVLPMELLSPA